ncbi:MAG: hypothetical protein AABY92_02115 [Thermodesulfobacteriota bacterium]
MVALMGEEFFVPHASPQSQTERLCREFIASGKKICTFDSAINAHLLKSGFKPINTDNFHDYIHHVTGKKELTGMALSPLCPPPDQ